jgi:hypothetical protein
MTDTGPYLGAAARRTAACLLPRCTRARDPDRGGTQVLDLPAREVEMALPGGFKVDPRTRAAVKSLPGIIAMARQACERAPPRAV